MLLPPAELLTTPFLAWDGVWLCTLAASKGFQAAESQLQVAMWAAGGLALVVFMMSLLMGRRRLENSDKLNVDWAAEEARMKRIAELRKATRSNEEQELAASSQPADRANAGVESQPLRIIPEAAATDAAPSDAQSAPPAEGADDSPLGRIMGGLSD